MRRLARWLLTRPCSPTRRPATLRFEPLEERVVPDGRPLPFPVIAVGPGAGAGLVRMFDAETGAEVLNVAPYQNTFLGGIRVAVGDLTGDFYPDLVTAAGKGGGPHVRVFDGKSGQQIEGPLGSFYAYDPSFNGGVQVAVGDVTGDSRPDLVTSADAGGGPHVRVYDGVTGALAYNFYAFEPSFTGGVRLAVGEFTGDGRSELVLAAGFGGSPRVRVLETATLEPIAGPLGDFYAFDPAERGGVWVATGDLTADVTADGRADLVVGAGVGHTPEVKAFDGMSGSVVLSALAFDASYQGGVRVATAYVDDDPHADIVAGTGSGTAPRVKTLGGTTGQPVAGWAGDFDPNVGSFLGGVNVAAGNDPGETIVTKMTLTPSSRVVALGNPFSVSGHIETSPPLQNHYGGLDWNGDETSDQTIGGPAADWTSNHTYTSLPLVSLIDIGWVTQAWGYFAYPGAGTTEALVVGIGLPLDLGGCGSGSVAQPMTWEQYIGRLRQARGGVKNAGVTTIQATDLGSAGFGGVWGASRSWSNDVRYSAGSALGVGWVSDQAPRLLKFTTGLVLITDASIATYYDGQGTPDGDGNYASYLPRHGGLSAIAFDSATDEFVLDEGTGGRLRFNGFVSTMMGGQQGSFQTRIEPGGATTSVYSRDGLGRPTEVRRSATVGGQTVTESYLSEYLPDSSPNAGLLWKVMLRRQVGGGAWETVRQVEYSYYLPNESGGSVFDLERATVTDAAGNVLDQTYYRYYTADTFDGSTQIGYKGGMKYALGAEAYARLKAASGGTDAGVEVASDATVAQYADQAMQFDAQKQVTKLTASAAGCSMCSAGQGTYTYSYTTSSNPAGYNSWATKTVETLPDNNQVTQYANAYGQVMLEVYKDTTTNQEWRTYQRYDGDGRLVLTANPSAVTGHSESYADLVNYQGATAQYLADSAGLVATYSFSATTTATETTAGSAAGFLESHSVRQGETGTDVPQAEWTYFRRTAGGATVTPVATQTRFRNSNGTGDQTTSYAYTWQSGTTQAESVTTTLPTVTTAQNGPGTAATSTVVYDSYGQPIWVKDADGFLHYAEYDTATGAVTKSIADVDSDLTSDFSNLPSGWSHSTGLHLKSIYEVDFLGRTTKLTDPEAHVTYRVFDDDAFEVRTYRGWDSTTNLPTGPTEVMRDDRANGYTEAITMSATPAVTSGRPTGTEAIGGIESLSRSYRNTAGQTTHTDAYFNLSGLTYTTSATLGSEGIHFYRTRQDYDQQGRPNRTVSPAGTITRTVIDGQGRAVSDWIGTDDTPDTGFWSPTNLAGTDMVKVREYEYDGGGVGDGNLTRMTEIPGGGEADRVTLTWFDWRNRPVIRKAGVGVMESPSVNRPLSYTEYDNLDQAIVTELYDGDAVTVTVTGGVPDRPSSSLMRAKSTAEFDEWGRAFRTKAFSVDSSGSVSTAALTTDTWFGLRGNAIKTASPGGVVQKVAYDGVGRATTIYTTDGGGDTSWADANDVVGEVVLEQVEIAHDANSNPVQVTSRQRFHDETGTGALGTPTSGVNARASYTGAYYDLADRLIASVDMGTNGGVAWTVPTSIPGRADTVLVTDYVYDDAGRLWKMIDPRGLEARTEYDLLGQTIRTIENYVDGVVSDTDDKTTEYGYGPAGMTSLTAKLTGGGVQTTEWLYGVGPASGSAITSNDIVGATKWPDPATGQASSGEQETVTVNGLGQVVTSTDRNGTVHTLSYDVLGRLVSDAVTQLGANVDGSVRRIEVAYDGQGNPFLITSYTAASGGSVVNQVQRDFNGLGQLVKEHQSHSGAVVVGTTPVVQYAYSEMTGGANHSRLTGIVYPNGRTVSYDYGTVGGLNDQISRLAALKDGTMILEGYDYLGLGTVVRRSHPQPGVDLSYILQIPEAIGDAGDQYNGLDRFGRVKDQRWIKTSNGSHTDRFQYGYDRNSNRTYRDNLVNTAFGEVYTYDGLNQLAMFKRGTLNATKTDVTGTPSRQQSWDHDALGNFDSVTTDGSAQTRTHNRQNEVGTVSGATSPTFDANGNMTRDETGKQFVYDAWNRLKVVKDAGGTTLKTYAYDGLGRRVTEAAGAVTTNLYYSAAWQVLEERVGGVAKMQYVWSPVYIDALIVRDRDTDGNGSLEERLWAAQDANFNTTALINSSGGVVERFVYDPFGKVTVLDANWGADADEASDFGWGYLWQGRPLDTASGTYNFREREVSPTMGRPLQVDPLGLGPDVNPYRWEGNGPVNWLDPSGLQGRPSSWPPGMVPNPDSPSRASIITGTYQFWVPDPNAPQPPNNQSDGYYHDYLPTTVYILPGQVGPSGQLVRYLTPEQVRNGNPLVVGISPTDPSSTIRPGTHATGRHIIFNRGLSPLISASTNPFGSPNYAKGDLAFWIDIKRFVQSGGQIVSTNDIRADLAEQVRAGQISPETIRIWEASQRGWRAENEVLLKGQVPPNTMTQMGSTSRFLMRAGKGAGYVGMAKAAWDNARAAQESVQQGSPLPLAKEVGKTAGGFAGAWVGAKLGAAFAGAVFAPTGPGAIAAGLVGSVVGGFLGYTGAECLIGD